MIGEFNKLNLSLKWFLSSILVIMPFWFLTIYALKPSMIVTDSIYIPIIISFCLSTVNFSFVLFSMLVLTSYSSNKGDINLQFGLALVVTFLLVCLVSYISYYASTRLIFCINITSWITAAFALISFIRILFKKDDKK